LSAIWWQIVFVSHMKQKNLIEIPPYYIDTLVQATPVFETSSKKG
jgi:hypothetical protein